MDVLGLYGIFLQERHKHCEIDGLNSVISTDIDKKVLIINEKYRKNTTLL